MSSDSDSDSDYDDAPATETSNQARFTIDKTHPQIITLVGNPRSGKSTLLKSILYRYAYQEKFFKSGLIFCPSDDGDLEEWIDEKYVITTYTEESLLGYIDKLRKKQHEKRKELEKAGRKKKYILPPNFLVLDDLSQGMINWYSPGIANWLSRFRKTNTWVFITSQYLNQGSSTALREYTSIFAFFAQKTTNALNGAYRATGGAMFENKKEFFKVLRKITDKEYTTLVFAEANPPDKRVFSFKCELPPEGWKITFGKDERGRQQQAKQEHGNSSAQNATSQNNILNVIDSAVRRYQSRAGQ
jgi:ABC-type dipeptide/oligopeptide/nickel transport system ATPase component